MKRNLLRFVLLSVMGLFTLGASAQDYLCFTANTASSTVKLKKSYSPTEVTLQTSTDGTTWSDYTIGTDITLANAGDKVYFRNASEDVTGIITDSRNYYNFVMSGSITASGNVMSLIDKSCQATAITTDGCFRRLFYNCEALTSAPELPAKTLFSSCYTQMFYNCSNLTTAPELPATTLEYSCYNQMFWKCSSLNDIKIALPAWVPDNNYNRTYYWVKDIKSTGTFSCPEGLDVTPVGTETFPTGWTVKNTYDLTITSETGWASMCVNLPLIVPTGVDVYYASAVEGSTIELTQIAAGTVMAAKTAVIVKGAKGTVGFPIAGEAGTSYKNLFQGSSVAKACNAGENYVLNASKSSDTNVHFSIYTGTTLTDHKAYLPKSAVGGATGSIQFRFGDATAISTVEMESNDDVLYNMAGQRVSSDYRGIVIKNGKKTWNN